MKTLRVILLAAVCAVAAQAAPSLTLLPPGANLTGVAGGLVSWNLQIENDADYLLINNIRYETVTPIGTFIDLLTPLATSAVGPGSSISGELAYSLDSLVPVGTLSLGQLIMTYTMTSVDPDDPGFNPDTDILADGAEIGIDASVNVVEPSAVPEPAGITMAALGLAALALRRRQRDNGH